ncbi:hypothetical protein [Streptomyces rimosus]|uniref:hypothetical protein n=1 Tax=Streptomyces rimosus TaxID=1927 RepID=UPI0004BEBE8B|nr:hypothetical protein [Streptomyces rimosus]
MTTTPADVAVVLQRLMIATSASEENAVIESAVNAGLMWRCPCGGTNPYDANACDLCAADRLWAADATPPRCEYGKLLIDLREGLKFWFDDLAPARRPAAVGFRITEYDNGPAWATWGATVYFTDSPDGVEYPLDFEGSWVADALVEISAFDPPQTGDTLRVVVPAI